MPTRSFIAIDLPDTAKEEISDLIASLGSADADVRWVRKENLHLTLKFLGNATEEELTAARDFLGRLAAGQKSFRIRLAGLGGFPGLTRPQVVWVGVEEGTEALAGLAAKIRAADFSPHLTLGRVRGGKNLRKLTKRLKKTPFTLSTCFEADHVTLYKSALTRDGAIYEPIEAFSFGK